MFGRSLLRRRWPFASKLLSGLAIASGLAAALLVRGMESRLEAADPASGAPVSVVVAAVDAARGSTIGRRTVRLEPMPSTYVPPGALTDIGEAVGRVLVADIAAGEVLTRTRTTSRAAGPVAALVPPGLRAVAVTVAASAADLRPGDHVDLLAAFGGGAPHTEIVAEGLELLRVTPAGSEPGGPSVAGATPGSTPAAKASVLLLVDPEVAERIAFAQAFASLSVAIVPAGGDDQGPATPGVASSEGASRGVASLEGTATPVPPPASSMDTP